MIPMKENQASALTIVADRPTKRVIGQKVCVPNPSKLDNYLNGEAHSTQLHHPT